MRVDQPIRDQLEPEAIKELEQEEGPDWEEKLRKFLESGGGQPSEFGFLAESLGEAGKL